MAGTPDAHLDRALERVRPRWDRERHERVFAAIIDRIRREREEERRGGQRGAAGRARLRLSHAAR